MFIYSSLYTVTRYHVSHLQESSAIKKPVYCLLDAVSDEVANDNEETYFNRIYSSYVSGHGGGGESSLVPSPSVYVHFYSHIVYVTLQLILLQLGGHGGGGRRRPRRT